MLLRHVAYLLLDELLVLLLLQSQFPLPIMLLLQSQFPLHVHVVDINSWPRAIVCVVTVLFLLQFPFYF